MEPTQYAASAAGSQKNIIFIIAVAVIVIAAVVYFVFLKPKAVEVPADSAEETSQNEAGLGAELYERNANPIETLPDAGASTPNPIEGVYKNPFE